MEHENDTLMKPVWRSLERVVSEEALRHITVIGAFGALLITVFIMLIKLLTHFPFFDEVVNAHYLWLFSSGLRPGTDFFCIYPALGYLLTMPMMSIFPDSALTLLGMRGFTLLIGILIGVIFCRHGKKLSGDWIAGLLPFLLIVKSPAMGSFFVEYSIDHLSSIAALTALTVCFMTPQKRSIGIAAALSVVSLAITPKYMLPLFLGFAGNLVVYYSRNRKAASIVGTAVAGVLCGLAIVVIIYALTGTSIETNFRHSYLLLIEWNSKNSNLGFTAGQMPVAIAIVEFLVRNWVFGIFVVMGIIGWVARVCRTPDATALPQAGILLGVLVSSFLFNEFISQYVAPRVLCLALFVPYAFTLSRITLVNQVLKFVFVVGAILTLTSRVDDVANNFDMTPMNVRGITRTHARSVDIISMAPPGVLVLADYDHLLEVIPQNERVVAVWPFHPIFRRDLAFVGIDERPTFRDIIPGEDILRFRFTPDYFLNELENHPPALISLPRLEDNYPPGWKEVAESFLTRHSEMYVPFGTRFFKFSIRRDLIKNSPGISKLIRETELSGKQGGN